LDGCTVGIRTDVTSEKTAELKLRKALDETSLSSRRLADIVVRATGGVTAIKAATAQLADGATELSARTEEQISSLDEMAASIRQFSRNVARNAENAQHAQEVSQSTRSAVETVGSLANDAAAAMNSIRASSGEIGDIVGLIEEIAQQTNLLALNAAVEAARAGDAGRGFGVVAAEVRALAQRTAEASKQIRSLVRQSSGEVMRGVELVGKANGALTEIVGSVRRAAEIVAEIAGANQEQSIAIKQVERTVTQLEDLTRSNAEMIEDATGAITTVDGQVEALMKVASLTHNTRSHSVGASSILSKATVALREMQPSIIQRPRLQQT
jgi:methyl-accepting chemotaxis protein